ncbi:AAA family ATPase [Desulfonema magnum]|uniref:AAA ATPase-like domain-containing protein n=1 Tax=Desulfonema magnum TaxID=45655 RepID=A0A975BW86_9BACT|nr:AAA family ATPase [Desulfonema magnum]QTA92527.1 AAA ATPase-like domain-containing protein [Desulfonema magnum]
MKISRIEIKETYYQFKDFTLNLTYPKGHEKEGKPLDKVCFIGQSGTGKTNLLNVCKSLATWDSRHRNSDMKHISAVSYLEEGVKLISGIENGRLTDEYPDNRKLERTENKREYWEKCYADTNILISFPAEISMNLNQILQEKRNADPMDFLKTEVESATHLADVNFEDKIFDFEKQNALAVWEFILKDIKHYKEEELRHSQKLAKAFTVNIEEGERLLEKFKKWKKEQPNPIESLAQKLNPLLNRFNLEINRDFDFESAEDLKFIKIKTLNGIQVPYKGWSTGTKQVILTATPLFKLNTEKTVILIDEPERSLYPDIQTEIVNYYTALAPQAQFFFATHSPMIASSFEPWEIVELKFGKDGYVCQEKYYEGENHTDNYFIDPRFLRWDSILMNLFDLGVEGNETFRNKALTKALYLKARLRKLKAQDKTDTEEGKKMLEEFEKLAKKLGWRLDEKN